MSDTSTASAQMGVLIPGVSDFNTTDFHSKRLFSQLRTMVPVKVIKVYKQDRKTTALQGEVAGAGFVDVQPVVSMMDGSGNTQPHGIVYGLPYTRIYGGNNAHIQDPVAGDFGWISCADRDIQSFINNAIQGNSQGSSAGQGGSGQSTQGSGGISPGSYRRFDMADGIYVGGELNKKPKQYMTFTSTGLQIQDMSKNTITMDNSQASNANTAQLFGNGNATGASATNTNTGIMGIQHADMNQNLLQMLPQQFNMISTLANTIMKRSNSASGGQINDNASGTNGSYSCSATSSITDTAQNINHTGITNFTGAFNIGSASNLISSSNITAVDIFGNINPSSDARIKTDNEPLVGAVDLIMELQVYRYTQTRSTVVDGEVVPYTFDAVSGEKIESVPFRSFGVHAQELREVLPELVKGDEKTDILSVEEPKLGILACAAIQELVNEIRELKARVRELEAIAYPMG